MYQGIVRLMTWVVILVVFLTAASIFGHSPIDKLRELVKGKEVITKEVIEEKKATDKVIADENRLACLAHLIWHANWHKGDGNPEKAALIGVVAKNLQMHLKEIDICTIFSDGLIELPEERTPETVDSRIYHLMEVVSVQKGTTTRSVQYSDAFEVAQKVMTAQDPATLLTPEYQPARCAKHLLRARFGPLVWLTAGSRKNIRDALVAQHGEPVFTATDGTEFFGRCSS